MISVSIQDIRPNPQDTSNFYLANIYQTLASQQNTSNSPPASPPTFSPPNYAVWVNKLWFLSLVISLTCALLATLLQQWARRYLRITQPRYSLHKRARFRAFFYEGVEKALLPWVVDALPTLLHISLFLFFGGLAVFLCHVHLTIFKSVLSWIGVCTALYGYFTVMPIFRHDSPYNTPLSSPLWHIVAGIPYVVFRFHQWLAVVFRFRWWLDVVFRFRWWLNDVFRLGLWLDNIVFRFRLRLWLAFVIDFRETYGRFLNLEDRYCKMFVQGMLRTVGQTALNSPSEIDARALMWTFDTLDEDQELERFFSGLPDFRSSNVVDDPLPLLGPFRREKLSEAVAGLFDRTFSSDLLPESVKNRRAIICARALDVEFLSDLSYDHIMRRILFGDECRELQTTKFGHIVRGWGSSGEESTAIMRQAIVTGIIAKVQQRDGSWFSLASNELDIAEPVLRDYAAHGDSLSLAILVHITRQHFNLFKEPFWPAFWNFLEAASKFNVRDTSPELQHEFCALWNEIVLKAQNDNDWGMTYNILGKIRNIYITLHQDTDSALTRFSSSTADDDYILFVPFSYPVCRVPGHIHDGSVSAAFSPAVLSGDAAPVTASIPDEPSSSVSVPLHNTADVRHPHNEKSIPGPILSTRQSAMIENLSIPTTSLDLVTACVIQGGIEMSTKTMPLSTIESSALASRPISNISTLSPGDVAIQNVTDRKTPSAFSASPSPAHVLSIGPLLSSNSLTKSDHHLP